MKINRNYLIHMYNATSTDIGNDTLETYEAWLERQLISRIKLINKAQVQPKEISVTDEEIEKHAKEYLKAIHTPITKREVHELLVIFGHWMRGKLKRTI